MKKIFCLSLFLISLFSFGQYETPVTGSGTPTFLSYWISAKKLGNSPLSIGTNVVSVSKHINYSANFGASYTTRSLVDKRYVDSLALTITVGTGTQNFISKWNNVSGTTLGNSLIYDNATNVGIGTTTVPANLTVRGTSNSSAVDNILFESFSGTALFELDNAGRLGLGGSPGAGGSRIFLEGGFFESRGSDASGATSAMRILNGNSDRVFEAFNNGLFIINNGAGFGVAGERLAVWGEITSGVTTQNTGASALRILNNSGGAANVIFNLTDSGQLGIGTATPTSSLQVVGLPVYATNALAVAGGLTAGAFYRTGLDPDVVCVVH